MLLLLLVAQHLRPAFARSEPPVLRGRGLEIVDAQGRVRASISVLPPTRITFRMSETLSFASCKAFVQQVSVRATSGPSNASNSFLEMLIFDPFN